MKSTMQHQFQRLPQVNIPRSKFDRSHGLKTTFDSGRLIPIYCDEALPGDTHILSLTAFARLATPIVPVMDNMYMDFHFWSVPIRLIWDNFQKFMGEQENPGDSTSFTIPQIALTNVQHGEFFDYLGVPTLTTNTFNISALWARAYNLIWNQFYRDENMQDSRFISKNDGPDDFNEYNLLARGKRHDYFTSALPFPQKGAAVEIPLGTTAPILRTDNAPNAMIPYNIGTNTFAPQPNNTEGVLFGAKGTGIGTIQTTDIREDLQPDTPYQKINFDPAGSLYTDLTSAAAATINSLRQAFQIQAMLELDARGGTRYTEKIQAHFGVTSPDSRLQRPEFLGGGSIQLNTTAVSKTAGATGQIGVQGGYSIAAGSGVSFSASFTEHAVLIGLVSVRADLNYQQGIERQWLRQTQFDFFWPKLAQIGEQAIENQEIYFDDITPANNAITFGYAERYAEYRFKQSKITGIFRSDAPGTLDFWHLAQDFASLPQLNDSFMRDTPPIDRIVAVPTEPQFLYDSFISLVSVRPIPMYGTPFNFARM